MLAYRSRRVCGPKTERTGLDTEHIVRSYLIPRWEEEIADDIKSLDIQRWLKSLHNDDGLAWTTISKMRGTMLGVYKVGILHELVTRNPVLPVETRCTTSYRAILVTPQQTLVIIENLPNVPAPHSGAELCRDRIALFGTAFSQVE